MVYGGFLLTTLKLAAKLYIRTQLKKKNDDIFQCKSSTHPSLTDQVFDIWNRQHKQIDELILSDTFTELEYI